MQKKRSSNLILIGHKGCGKSFFGEALALKTKKKFIDSDRLIESLFEKKFKEALSCRQIGAKLGEKKFRILEEEIIETLIEIEDTIIALGGGTLDSKKNGLLLPKLGRVIFLKTEKKLIEKRVFHEGVPPFLMGKDPKKNFQEIYRKRNLIFKSLMDGEIVLEGKKNSEIIEELEKLRKWE